MHSAEIASAGRQPKCCENQPSGAVAHNAPIMPMAFDRLTTRMYCRSESCSDA